MKLEIHILQNFAPSNLNRDDTGAPKDCELGGVRRARISSQCFKRAIRDAFARHALVPEDQRAARTKRIVEQVAAIVVERKKVDPEAARKAVTAVLGSVDLKADPEKDYKTQYLLFLPTRTVGKLAMLVVEHFEALASEAGGDAKKAPGDEAKKGSKGKKIKGESNAIAPEIAARVEELLADASGVPELSLFGRMIADAPHWNVDAACQVAHAISTHRVSMEFDFYTAIDDLKKNDSAGSDMMGTVSFNSACFYRYLVLDTDALAENLGSDEVAKKQARASAEALLRAAVLAIPSGKQNSMAAHNPPSLVLVDVRDGGEPRSLANAFVDPARPRAGDDGDLVSQSIAKLGAYAADLDRVYGTKGRKDRSFIAVGAPDAVTGELAKKTGATDQKTLDALVGAAIGAAFGAAS